MIAINFRLVRLISGSSGVAGDSRSIACHSIHDSQEALLRVAGTVSSVNGNVLIIPIHKCMYLPVENSDYMPASIRDGKAAAISG